MELKMNLGKNGELRYGDVAGVVRLISGASAVAGGLSERRRFLFEGLSRITGADAWVWIKSGRNYLGDLAAFAVCQKGGFTDQQFARFLGECLAMRGLCSRVVDEVALLNQQVTRLCQDLDPRWTEDGSDLRAEWEKIDIGAMLFSFLPLDAHSIMRGLILFRRSGRELFDQQDLAIVHAIVSGVSWLHEDEVVAPRFDAAAFDMSPRVNAVLNLLLQGLARKEVAAELGISLNTVGGYIKELYQRFGVHSQVELIRQFVDGGNSRRQST